MSTRWLLARSAAVTVAVTMIGLPRAATPAPQRATQPPRPEPGQSQPLRLDVARHVDEVVARHDLPRFEERVEVEGAPIDRFLRGVDLECQPSSSGPPPVAELGRYRGASIPPHWDYLRAAKQALKLIQSIFGTKARYYLYADRRGARPSFVLRDGPLPDAALRAGPTEAWELLATFDSLKAGSETVRRLERGFVEARRTTEGEPPPVWFGATCRMPEWK